MAQQHEGHNSGAHTLMATSLSLIEPKTHWHQKTSQLPRASEVMDLRGEPTFTT